MQNRRHVWTIVVGVLLTLIGIFTGVGKSKSPIDTPTAFSLEPIQRNARALAAQSATSPVVEPKWPQWPECSLPLLDKSDRNTFIEHAKQWTPECRMQTVKKACSPHCIYSDEYIAIIEAAADLAEGKSLLGAVLAANKAELKHARDALTDMKKFAAYTKTIMPHGTSTPNGRECLERMGRDRERVDHMREAVKARFAMFIVSSALTHAGLCVTCSEAPSRERECNWMHEEIAKGESRLREVEKDHANMTKMMVRK